VFAGIPNPFSGEFASSGKFGNLPPDATVLAHGMDWGEPTTIEYPIGRGWFWSFTGALEAAHAWGWEGGPMMENSILWGYSYAPEQLPWLSQTPGSGTVAANECLTVPVGFDAQNLAVGVYTASLEVDSSDPGTPEIDIPVNLTVAVPLQVEFNSNSPVMLGEPAVFTSTVPGVVPFEFLWEFGDGLSSTLENPTHLYQSAGTFSVTLTVSGADGTASATHPFQVIAPPEYIAYLPLLLKADTAP
jgi:PKD repeat protein